MIISLSLPFSLSFFSPFSFPFFRQSPPFFSLSVSPPPPPRASFLPILILFLSLTLCGAGSFLGTAPLLPSGVTAPTDSGWSLAGTLVHSGGQRSDGGRGATETPESRPVSWLPGGSRLHRPCASAAILHSFGSMTVVHELSRVSWLRAASSSRRFPYPLAQPSPAPLPQPSSYPCRFLPLSRDSLLVTRARTTLAPVCEASSPLCTRAAALSLSSYSPGPTGSVAKALLPQQPLSRACNILASERASESNRQTEPRRVEWL